MHLANPGQEAGSRCVGGICQDTGLIHQGGNVAAASSARTKTRHRLNRGGHRQANAALYRTVIVRMRFHEPTIAYVERRMAEGRTKAEIIRCLKRFVAREVWAIMRPLREQPRTQPEAA